MKLYRYIPALDRRDEDKLYFGMLDDLQNGRLKFAHPADFNDPMEAVTPYRFIRHGEIVSPNLEEIRQTIQSTADIKDWNTPRGRRILAILPFGVPLEYALMLSMSKVKDHQLMWAHYAGNHKGICLEFDFPDDFLSKVKWSEQAEFHMASFGLVPSSGEVSYKHTRPPIVFSDGIAENDYDISGALFSKPKCWAYEQEYRILLCYPWNGVCRFAAGSKANNDYFFEYPKGWLTGITLGISLKDMFRKKIVACVCAAGYQNVRWSEEKLKNGSFEITSGPIDI